MQIEEGDRAVEQHMRGDRQHNLVEMKKHNDEREAAYGMLHVDPRAHRRSDVADDCLRDPVQTDGIVVTQRILQNPDKRPEKQARSGIAPADAEINCDEQRQFDELAPVAVFVQKRLQNDRQNRRDGDRPCVVFVDFDVLLRFDPGIECERHVSLSLARPVLELSGYWVSHCWKQEPRRALKCQ